MQSYNVQCYSCASSSAASTLFRVLHPLLVPHRKHSPCPERLLTPPPMQVDMEKLADSLQRLSEDDLLQVVQMVHDHKTQETYIKNDVESKKPPVHSSSSVQTRSSRNRLTHSPVMICTDGEFHVDLYTLPDALIKMLWEFATEKAGGLQ